MRGATAAMAMLAILVLGPLGAACSAPDDDALVAALPSSLLDRGALWQRGPVGADRLLDLLDLPAGDTRATVVTGRPSVTLIDHGDAGRAVTAAEARGYEEAAAPDGWSLRVRGEVEDEAELGVPAVGVAGDLVVVGSPEEIRAVAEHTALDTGTTVPVEVLDGAIAALLGTPATAETAGEASGQGAVPGYDAFAITVTGEGAGVIALARPGASQADAVALSVRLNTAQIGEGTALTSLLQPEAPLATEDRVLVPVRWLTDPPEIVVVEGGPDSGLVRVLRVGG